MYDKLRGSEYIECAGHDCIGFVDILPDKKQLVTWSRSKCFYKYDVVQERNCTTRKISSREFYSDVENNHSRDAMLCLYCTGHFLKSHDFTSM